MGMHYTWQNMVHVQKHVIVIFKRLVAVQASIVGKPRQSLGRRPKERTYYKPHGLLSRTASVSKKSGFVNVTVSATWIHPLVQSCLSPTATD